MANNNPKSDATLRIFSKTLSINEISKMLEVEPSYYHVIGSKSIPDHPKSYVYPSNVWLLDSGLDRSEPLESHLTKIIMFIEIHLSAMTELQKNCDMDIFCGFISNVGQGSFIISPELLKRMTILPIKIIIDLYPPNLNDKEQS